jgi:hypothetical protein
MQIAGVTLRQERDLSVVLAFPSGRRERVRMTPVPPSGAVMDLFAKVDPWRPPPPLGFVAYAHLLPAALAEDMRRKEEPYVNDATRVAFALLATDYVPVRGVFGNTSFYGWIRLTREEWTTLFTALAERVTPAGSSAGVVRDGRFVGVGVIEGLAGTGDGAEFSPLRITLSGRRSPEEIRRLDLTRYALVSVEAQFVPDNGRPGTRRWQVNVSPVGPATDLRGGTLLPVVLRIAGPPATAPSVRLGGLVQTRRGLDYGVDADGVEVIDTSQVRHGLRSPAKD